MNSIASMYTFVSSLFYSSSKTPSKASDLKNDETQKPVVSTNEQAANKSAAVSQRTLSASQNPSSVDDDWVDIGTKKDKRIARENTWTILDSNAAEIDHNTDRQAQPPVAVEGQSPLPEQPPVLTSAAKWALREAELDRLTQARIFRTLMFGTSRVVSKTTNTKQPFPRSRQLHISSTQRNVNHTRPMQQPVPASARKVKR